MIVIRARNVHAALHVALNHPDFTVMRESRNGKVIMFPEPVTTVYQAPLERVVFWKERDANPFFHFYESLWMLGGRNDVASLTRYVPRMKDFSDDGEKFAGAYGYRWRNHFQSGDQLVEIISNLKKNPNDRRQVLQMWDTDFDLRDQEGAKDLPCNTQAMFSVNHAGALDMLVTNRSNDIILGAYGANAVHFSYLQEYVAWFAGYPVGTYRQVSNNFHAYMNKDLEKLQPLLGAKPTQPYDSTVIRHVPLTNTADRAEWDAQLGSFLDNHRAEPGMDLFFRKVADPIIRAHALYKADKDLRRFNSIHAVLHTCKDTAWRAACQQWMLEREARETRAKEDGPSHE
jgi:thymidylate synthase